MRKEFYDDLYLYETIKGVLNTQDDNRVSPIFKQLFNTTWKIQDIERLDKKR